MSMRKAFGSLKDTTRVGLVKINSEYKILDVAIVKATNHVEAPPKEKHVRTIFAATSAARPRADVAYCIHALAKRLSKTQNWTVALKTLMVMHRTLREGDPTFREELINYARNRGHILNLSNFKDDSSPVAWDCSAWVRTYALYLEERLEAFRILKYDIESERSTGHSRTRELDSPDLLEHLPALQQMLHRLMNCEPEGAAVTNHVIQAALGLVLKESFKLYRAINDGIINLVDKFFEMARHDASKALDIYKRAGQQAERLSVFYDTCKRLDLARNFQFPTLEQPPQSFLTTMEEYVRDAPRVSQPKEATGDSYEDDRPLQRRAGPSNVEEQRINQPVRNGAPPPPSNYNADNSDLLGMGDDPHPNANALEESNALALAIVPSGGPSANGDVPPPQDQTTTGWELALVSAPSQSTANGNAPAFTGQLAGGLDKLTLDSLYEDAVARPTVQSYAYGAAGQNLNTGAQQAAQPFQPQAAYQAPLDPFAASSNYAPPPTVQMAHMARHQQQMMAPQQGPYMQPQMMQPMQPAYGMMPVAANPYALNPYGMQQNPYAAVPGAAPMLALPAPPTAQYANNPFGNPHLM
eukprot:SM000017S02901  [mRNA]  locus=s17:991946:997058:+ [translate_table: standard]